MRQSSADKIACVADAMYFAKRPLPKFLYQRYENGTGPALTLRNNERAFQNIAFMPRAAVQFPKRELTTRILGQEVSMPVVLAPVGGCVPEPPARASWWWPGPLARPE
jgi:isopentenyl diphosphate isomerase/L-lactate dehydrogenase-like FMN-dependent dehydrogenase